MTYELWDLRSGNALGEFPTEGQALAAVRALLAHQGPPAVESLLLARTTMRGRSKPIAQEQALAALAQRTDAGAPDEPVRPPGRTAIPA